MRYSAVIAVALGCAPPAVAADDAAQRFGARPDIQQISLAPDGNHIAYIRPVDAQGAEVIVVDVHSGTQAAILNSPGSDRLRYCRWSTSARLVCGVYTIVSGMGQMLGFTRLVAIDIDGKNNKLLSAHDSSSALEINQNGGQIIDWLGDEQSSSVLMTRNVIPEFSTGTHIGNLRAGLGVERVDTVSLKRAVVEQPREDAVEYITDGHGIVRIVGLRGTASTGYDKTTIKYMYRRADRREFEELSTVELVGGQSVGFDPYAVDRDRNIAYGFDTVDGRTALFSIALDGTKKRAKILSRPDVDIDGLVQIGRQGRVVGATYATDRRVTEFFDTELKSLGKGLAKALPNLPLVSFVDASADEKKLLLFAGSDVDPGHYYLFDKITHKLDEVAPLRDRLADIKLAAVKPISYPAADGTMIPGYLTLPPGSQGKNLPTIVMPHGGPETRDEWGFDWLAQFFAHRGFAVLQPNFRGSTGYGEAWFKHNGFQSWRTAIDDVDDGGRWLVKAGIADPGKMAILGWSYGGYAALQSAVVDPTLFKAVVAIAPVTDFELLRAEHADYSNYAIEDARIGHGSHIRAGSPAQNVANIAVPVLMFHGDSDQNVGIGESRIMASRLKAAGKPVELVEFHNLDHQLDDSAARQTLLAKSDTFLRATMGMPVLP